MDLDMSLYPTKSNALCYSTKPVFLTPYGFTSSPITLLASKYFLFIHNKGLYENYYHSLEPPTSPHYLMNYAGYPI